MSKDQLLIQNLRSGSHDALRQLMMSYQQYVYSILISMLHEHEAAEASQDTFLKAFKHINSFKENSKLSTWLYRIAYRTGLDYLKKRRKSVDIDELTNHSTPSADESITSKLHQDDMNKALTQLFTKLKGDEAALLRMYYFDEMTLKEMAAITSMTESNLKVKLYRARKRMKELIESNQAPSMSEYLN